MSDNITYYHFADFGEFIFSLPDDYRIKAKNEGSKQYPYYVFDQPLMSRFYRYINKSPLKRRFYVSGGSLRIRNKNGEVDYTLQSCEKSSTYRSRINSFHHELKYDYGHKTITGKALKRLFVKILKEHHLKTIKVD